MIQDEERGEMKKFKPYQWIVFDADDTLFHFDAFAGLKLFFSRIGIIFTELDYQAYQAVNKALWLEYQNGKITATQLQYRRFESWGQALQAAPEDLNSAFLSAMAEICVPLEGAVSLLDTLKGRVKLGIITNGFTALQEKRLDRNGLTAHFNFVVISEQVGVAKPHPDIFEHAWQLMGCPKRNTVLMVGDNLDSDILGGMNAGFDTCWLNSTGKPVSQEIKPRYMVSSLHALAQLLRADS